MAITNKILFLSDFDGTMSSSEFFLVYVDNYARAENQILLAKTLAKEITSFDYLAGIFATPTLSNQTFLNHIEQFPLDKYVAPTIQWLKDHHCDFKVVSAGADAYIAPLLKRISTSPIEFFTNRAHFEGGTMIVKPAAEPFYGSYFGIDKSKVVRHLRNSYDTIIYAGDGSSDFEAALECDHIFAKSSLARKLTEVSQEFHPFTDYSDILQQLNEEKMFFSLDS